MTRRLLVAVTGLAIVTMATPALAHHLWLNATRYSLEASGDEYRGKTTISFGWGDFFPLHDFLKEDQVQRLALRAPGGVVRELKPGDGGFLATPVELGAKGAYMVSAALKPIFVASIMEDGKQKVVRKAKDELAPGTKVVLSQYSAQFAKALVTVGDVNAADPTIAAPIGHDLEIVPLANPAQLREGDHFRFRVLFKGAPLGRPNGNPEVKATYLGYSSAGDWVVSTGLDAEGIGRVRLSRYGVWQIFVSHTIEPPADLAGKADKVGYRASFTFEVR